MITEQQSAEPQQESWSVVASKRSQLKANATQTRPSVTVPALSTPPRFGRKQRWIFPPKSAVFVLPSTTSAVKERLCSGIDLNEHGIPMVALCPLFRVQIGS